MDSNTNLGYCEPFDVHCEYAESCNKSYCYAFGATIDSEEEQESTTDGKTILLFVRFLGTIKKKYNSNKCIAGHLDMCVEHEPYNAHDVIGMEEEIMDATNMYNVTIVDWKVYKTPPKTSCNEEK